MRVEKIPGFEFYTIDENSKVFSLKRKQYLKPSITGGMHYYVMLSKNNKRYKKYLHRLMLEVFVGECPEGLEALHGKNGPLNNSLENLRWGTRSENNYDQVRDGTHPESSKMYCKRGHLLEIFNLVQGKLPYRECLSCSKAAQSLNQKVRRKQINGYTENDKQILSDENFHKLLNN